MCFAHLLEIMKQLRCYVCKCELNKMVPNEQSGGICSPSLLHFNLQVRRRSNHRPSLAIHWKVTSEPDLVNPEGLNLPPRSTKETYVFWVNPSCQNVISFSSCSSITRRIKCQNVLEWFQFWLYPSVSHPRSCPLLIHTRLLVIFHMYIVYRS